MLKAGVNVNLTVDMDPKKRANLQLRTNKAFAVKFVIQQIDERYKLVIFGNLVTTDTGELRIFAIEPVEPGLPSASGRWDHKQNTVDIEVIRNGRTEKDFQGHHTTRNSAGGYDVDVPIAEGNIFTGTIELSTELGLLLKDFLSDSGTE